MHLMLEHVSKEQHDKLHQELTGPLRTMGPPMSKEELEAPAWWHGDEEAFESSMTVIAAHGGRRVISA